MSICDKTSNNKYFNCPPRMSDGRHFTDYRQSDYVNNLLRMTAHINGSYQYRQFLIHNATNLIMANNEYAKDKNGCHPCNFKPVEFKRECDVDLSNMHCKTIHHNGIGTQYKSGL